MVGTVTIKCCKECPPYGALLTLKSAGYDIDKTVVWTDATELSIDGLKLTTDGAIARYIARLAPNSSQLLGRNICEQSEVETWVSLSDQVSTGQIEPAKAIKMIETQLAQRDSLVGDGKRATLADLVVWAMLSAHEGNVASSKSLQSFFNKIKNDRSFASVHAMIGKYETAAADKAAKSAPAATKAKDEGKFVELPGAEMGKVVVRFPPEASGFLHIGHAKAALLNQYYQQAFNGQLIMRFDDTNPAKENAEFEKVILEDLKMLEVKPDRWTHTSDHFDTLLSLCERLLKEGKAFVDDTDPDTMKKEREERKNSRNRDLSAQQNLALWEEMKKGSERGQQCCVRIKMDMNSNNGCMRDPAIFRCKVETHVRTGDKYKTYPTYDFACPVVDSIEGVTHALRTTEYHDRDDQYYFICDALNLRKPHIWEYSRLNMTNTVMSKRKLTWFVDEGHVEGWDDPRFPTVRGVMRRGMTVEGLKQFIVAQGGSRSVVMMEWDKIWSFNKKVIDPVAPRFTALTADNLVTVNVKGQTKLESKSAALHPKNESVGEKNVWYGPTVKIEQADAREMEAGQTVTFMNWGNMKIVSVNKNKDGSVNSIDANLDLENTDYKKTLKVTWLAATESPKLVPVVGVHYDHIISKAVISKDEDWKNFINYNSQHNATFVGEPAMLDLKKGTIVQIQRKGYYICDRPYSASSPYSGAESPLVLISVPDGHVKEMPTAVKKQPASDAPAADRQRQSASPAKNQNAPAPSAADGETLKAQIDTQGELVRTLKSGGGSADDVKAAVAKLLELKAKYKEVTGVDLAPAPAGGKKKGKDAEKKPAEQPKQNAQKPANSAAQKQQPTMAPPAADNESNSGDAIKTEIDAQGELVRKLKSSGGSEAETKAAIAKLLELKAKYKEVTGVDLVAAGGGGGKKGKGGGEKKAADKPKAVEKAPQQAAPQAAGGDAGKDQKKQTKLGVETKKADNYSDWYSQVITKGEMIEYYDVSGCYVLRPWSYAIWEAIQAWFDKEIKKLGVKNAYFPMFVSQAALEREKTHIADFAPEVAWVTRSGQSELAEPIAIRPTSETVMYPSYAKWVQSHRDLPIKMNQWCNVVRWEFKHPTPFLRTREFLWQEGHTAFAAPAEAETEVFQILDLYAKIYTDLLAIPVIKGRKTEKEKFAGGDFTTTVEAYVPVNGRGIQGATSHHLGQNFSKMFDISFEDPETQSKTYAWQNSWGLSTRTIGAMVMIHGDDAGLVLPPRVAAIQVIIIACGITVQTTDKEKEQLLGRCEDYARQLMAAGVRAETDLRDNYSPGWKFNHWELKGVPIRLELGPRDMASKQFVVVRRDTAAKSTVAEAQLVSGITQLLDQIHHDMYESVRKARDEHMVVTEDWNVFKNKLELKFVIQAPFCGDGGCEDTIKKESAREDAADPGAPAMGAKSLCIPLEQPKKLAAGQKCVHPACNKPAKFYTLFGRSY